MAFRYSGKNWEGRVWNTPASLRSFGAQLDDQYPSRPTATDGTVASQNHDKVSPTSDHRPHPTTGPGVVRALDGTVTQEQGSMITEALRKSRDVRIKYVIWNRRSFSPNTDWEWEDHGGAPHDKHFHVSFRGEHDQDDSLWDLGQQEEPVPPLTEKEETRLKICLQLWRLLVR